MTTTTAVPTAIPTDELAELIANLPDFPRKFTKTQKAGDRVFSVSGPKADAIAAYIIRGGYTRSEIAEYVGCSQSRVAEVAWGMVDGGVFDEDSIKAQIVRRRKSEDEVAEGTPEAAATDAEPADEPKARKPRATKAA